ncbi:MAG: MFS transporter [Candidatus Abyssobacteria bacterium SURF_5]|uniref:MFS transporter n=1 Tax=Abyssobacteria bacterium (strain SURF_5) TaxID=2093360 RepID=A0A3A4NU36_ABYX5|nr:MAG: MFS transporter [Candidatus Abyssubacteria bacterium SURF_5]
MYDWANSAFATTILAAVFPIFYGRVAGATLPGNLATVYWGYTASAALFTVAFAAPILGAIADHSGAKKKFLLVFAALGIAFTALLATIQQGAWRPASFFFVLAYIGFAGSIIFYDSLLPHISKPEDIDRVSSKGFAIGYLGGGLLLALNLAWIMAPQVFMLKDTAAASRLSFFSVAVWWAIFSIPLFRKVPEPAASPLAGAISPVRGGFQRLSRTFHEIRRYKELTKFLVAFWLYSDGIGTVIKMATIYGSEIGIGTSSLIGALLMVQFIGFPATIAVGKIASRIGTKRAIFITLAIYCFISVGGYFMSRAWHFWALSVLVACAQGGAQALSRSLFGRMAPIEKSAEFFGFFSISSKFAGIVGPFLFAVVGQLTGTSRLSILSLIFFFVCGGLLLARVDVEEGLRASTGA